MARPSPFRSSPPPSRVFQTSLRRPLGPEQLIEGLFEMADWETTVAYADLPLKAFARMDDLFMVNPKTASELLLQGLEINESVLDADRKSLMERLERGDMGVICMDDPENPGYGMIAITFVPTKGYGHSMDGMLKDRNMGEGPPDTINFISVIRMDKIPGPDGKIVIRKLPGGLGKDIILRASSYLWSIYHAKRININTFITMSPVDLVKWLETMQRIKELPPEKIKMHAALVEQMRRDEALARSLINKRRYPFDLDGLLMRLKNMSKQAMLADPDVLLAQRQLCAVYGTSGAFVPDRKDPDKLVFQSSDDVAGFHEGNGGKFEGTVGASNGTKANNRFLYELIVTGIKDGRPVFDLRILESRATSYKSGNPPRSAEVVSMLRPRPPRSRMAAVWQKAAAFKPGWHWLGYRPEPV
jgi:hypothetical protein